MLTLKGPLTGNQGLNALEVREKNQRTGFFLNHLRKTLAPMSKSPLTITLLIKWTLIDSRFAFSNWVFSEQVKNHKSWKLSSLMQSRDACNICICLSAQCVSTFGAYHKCNWILTSSFGWCSSKGYWLSPWFEFQNFFYYLDSAKKVICNLKWNWQNPFVHAWCAHAEPKRQR